MNLKLNLDTLAPAPGSTLLWIMFSGNDLDDKYYPELEPPAADGSLVRALVKWQSFRRRWRDSGELLWWRDDSHWNPAGHKVAAELIHKRLLN